MNTRWRGPQRVSLASRRPEGLSQAAFCYSNIDMVETRSRLIGRPATGGNRAESGQAEILDLMTHEHIFWPFYSAYLADHPQRIETAIRWATDRGYEPVFLHEGFLGLPV